MFKVTIPEEYCFWRSYYVYDANELVEVKKLSDYSFFGINNDSMHVDIINDGDSLAAVITHTTPTIIKSDTVDKANDPTLRKTFISQLNNPTLTYIDFLPCTEITKEEYNLLFELAKEQGYFNRDTFLEQGIQNARQYIHQNDKRAY